MTSVGFRDMEPSSTVEIFGYFLNTYNAIFALIWILFAWETYLNLRQNRVAKKTTKPPTEIRLLISDTEFEKARLYSIDKMNFEIVNGFYNIVSLSVVLHFQLISWAWSLAKTHVFFLDSISPWSFGLTENNKIPISLLVVVYVGIFQFIESLPWSYYRNFVIEARYGFNKQTVGFFIKDRIKSLVVGLVIGLPLVSAIIWIIEVGGEHFYVYAYAFTFVISMILMFVYPEFIAPLFDRYEPLPEGTLRTKIEALASKIGFPLKKLYVVEGSKRSSHSNAYFYGFGNNKRIVLYDTLIKGFKIPNAKNTPLDSTEDDEEAFKRGCEDDEEIIAVLGHELGHWKRNHVNYYLIISQVNLFFLFFAFGKLVDVDALFVGFGFPPGTSPTLIRLMVVFQFIFMPYSSVLEFLMTVLSRKFEFQADAFAVGLDSGEKLKSALLVLTKDNLSFPVHDWLYSMCNHSHPPVLERIKAIDALIAKNN